MAIELTLIEQQTKAISEQLGVQVDVQLIDYERLLRQGVIGEVHCGRWRATASLVAADFGIKLNKETEKTLLTLGKKLLMPAGMVSAANAIESRARRLVDPKQNKAVFATPMGTFIPITAWADIKQRFDDCLLDYNNIRDQWCDNLEVVREEMAEAYAKAAAEAWQRMQRENPDLTTTEEEYIDTFVSRVMAHIPDAEHIRASFKLQLSVHWVPLPSLLAAELARTQNIELQTELGNEELRNKLDLARRTADVERSRLNREEWANRTAAEARARELAELNRLVVAQTKAEVTAMANDFVATVATQMNSLIAETMTNILEALTKRKKLNNRTATQLKTMVRTLKQANFVDDKDINSVIARVEEVIAAKTATTNPAALGQLLNDIRIVTTDNLLRLGNPPKESRILGPTDLNRNTITAARTRIDLSAAALDLQPTLAKAERKKLA